MKKNKSAENELTAKNVKRLNLIEVDQGQDEQEMTSFFAEVMQKLPRRASEIVLNNYDKTKIQAENILSKSKDQFENVFDNFLEGVDDETRKKCHSTIHAASLTAAIIGCSPIPFSDAFLLVPVQLTMMARLHKLFGQSWSKSLSSSISKELVVVGLGRSAVGNLMKLVPTVGTIAGAAINGVVASTITEALGWTTVKMLNDGEDIFEELTSFKGQFKTLSKALKSSTK